MTLKHIRKSISKFSSLHVYLARKRLPGSDRGIQTNPFEILSQEVKKIDQSNMQSYLLW